MYAIGTLPLIRSLHDPGQWTQQCYVDDASASGALPELYNWFNQLCSYGPSFGYTTLNLQKVLSSSINNGRVMLLQCSTIWEFRW